MADVHDKKTRSYNMSRIRSGNTKPELIVRKFLHAQGFRYSLHKKTLPGKPDIVFPGRRKVVFVHGCFWHLHAKANCRDATVPKTNTNYWGPKLQRNRDRDQQNKKLLRKLGWQVCVIWECELSNEAIVRKRLEEFFRGAPTTSHS